MLTGITIDELFAGHKSAHVTRLKNSLKRLGITDVDYLRTANTHNLNSIPTEKIGDKSISLIREQLRLLGDYNLGDDNAGPLPNCLAVYETVQNIPLRALTLFPKRGFAIESIAQMILDYEPGVTMGEFDGLSADEVAELIMLLDNQHIFQPFERTDFVGWLRVLDLDIPTSPLYAIAS